MNYWYFDSLVPWPIKPYDITECVEWIKSIGNVLLKEVLIAATCYTIILFLSIYRVISKLWIVLFTLNLAFMCFYQTGGDLLDHGGINWFGVVCFIVIESVLLSILIWLKKLCSRGRKWVIILSMILTPLPFIYYFGFIHNSWKGWERGYGGRKLINGIGYWNIVTPNYCELKIRDGWFDVNRFSTSCKKQNTIVDFNSLPEHIKKNKNLKRLGYPRAEYYSNDIILNANKLAEEVDRGLIDMDNRNVDDSIKDNIEFVVDLSNSESHILNIDLKRNNTRAEELKKIREEVISDDIAKNNTERIDKNLLIFFIDNISRANFHRKLKKTSRFFDQLANNDESDFEVYEFFRYHSIETNTLRNYNALFYGLDGYLTTESRNVFQYFSKNGYITGSFFEEWNMVLNLLDPKMNYSTPFYHFDHFPGSIFCDKNYDKNWAATQCFGEGRNSPFERCLYGQTTSEIILNYTTQFWDKYPDVRKFFLTYFNEAHEFSGDLIKYNDRYYEKFLSNFKDKGYLKETQIIFMSDHGAHMIVTHAPLYPDDSRFEENMLPTFIYLTPKDIPKKSLEFLNKNQQQFMNSHDFYATLKSIAVGRRAGTEDIPDFAVQYEKLPLNRDWDGSKEINYTTCWCQNDISKIYEKKSHFGYFYIGFIIE